MKQHSLVTTITEVLHDIVEGLDAKKYFAAYFIDLSKAFGTVDNSIFCQKLLEIGLSQQTVRWFTNCLWSSTMCTAHHLSSNNFKIMRGGFILSPNTIFNLLIILIKLFLMPVCIYMLMTLLFISVLSVCNLHLVPSKQIVKALHTTICLLFHPALCSVSTKLT